MVAVSKSNSRMPPVYSLIKAFGKHCVIPGFFRDYIGFMLIDTNYDTKNPPTGLGFVEISLGWYSMCIFMFI